MRAKISVKAVDKNAMWPTLHGSQQSSKSNTCSAHS